MKVYTLEEASRETKIGVETLRRACKEGAIKASSLPSGEWRITESALEEALYEGLTFSRPAKKTGKKQPMPEHLRRYLEAEKAKKAKEKKAA